MAPSLEAAQKLKMSTIAPGSSAYLVMTTMATIVNQGQDNFEIKVDATGAATKHMIELAQGKMDLCMTSPVVYSMPIRLTQVETLGYDPAHVRLPSDSFGVSASLP